MMDEFSQGYGGIAAGMTTNRWPEMRFGLRDARRDASKEIKPKLQGNLVPVEKGNRATGPC